MFNLQQLRNDRYINEKELEDNVSSFNFSRKAFRHNVWNNETIQARGLFLNNQDGSVVARSYNKFFEYGADPSFRDPREMIYPIEWSIKANGYLGILSVYHNQFFFASKSTTHGPYAKRFKDNFYELIPVEYQNRLFKFLQENNATAVFEVIAPPEDTHIVEYTENNLILLDIIKNSDNFEYFDYRMLEKKKLLPLKFYKQWNILQKPDTQDKIFFEEIIKKTQGLEGFVFRDATGYMVKAKTLWYKKWKATRGLIQKITRGTNGEYNSYMTNILGKDLIAFYEKEVPNFIQKYKYTPSIIEMRHLYQNKLLEENRIEEYYK